MTWRRTDQVTVTAAFGAIYVLWGGTYLAIAVGLESIPAFLLMGSRSILGGIVLLFFRRSGTSPFDLSRIGCMPP
jgi:drug/metabolite transporter (DMT)-like permease